VAEDFRVEVELDDEHGYSLWERLRGLRLDDEARRRLGDKVVVTRDGSRLFMYAQDEQRAREAERVARSLIDEDRLSADIALTRWHPVEEEWKDISVPLPRTIEEERAEYQARVASETSEAEAEGRFDWQVVAELPSRDEASELANTLASEGLAVAHRWRYVVVGAVTEEAAEEIAARVLRDVAEAQVAVEADVSDVSAGPFQFVGF
jgi:hypothetical protein